MIFIQKVCVKMRNTNSSWRYQIGTNLIKSKYYKLSSITQLQIMKRATMYKYNSSARSEQHFCQNCVLEQGTVREVWCLSRI
jgi:hypothetical protein